MPRDYCPQCNTRQDHRRGRFGMECIVCVPEVTIATPVCDSTLDLFASPKQAPAQPVKTSEDAAAKVSPTLKHRRRDLLLWFLTHAMDGATDNEAIAALAEPDDAEWSRNGVRPRRIELYRAGWLEEAGERDGSTVWKPSQRAVDWINGRVAA